MPKYIVTTQERWSQQVVVTAETEEEALLLAAQGEGQPYGDPEYEMMLDPSTWSISPYLYDYEVRSDDGARIWEAETAGHAAEQHIDAFPDDPIISVERV